MASFFPLDFELGWRNQVYPFRLTVSRYRLDRRHDDLLGWNCHKIKLRKDHQLPVNRNIIYALVFLLYIVAANGFLLL